MNLACSLCLTKITDGNNSKEHIIPNAIGGRRTIKGFICDSCNNKTGDTWDAAVFKQLAPFCTMFGIKRHRGEVSPLSIQTLDGQEYYQQANGTFQLKRPEISTLEENGLVYQVSVKARDLVEARKIANGKLRGKTSENPPSKVHEEYVETESYLDSPVMHSLNFSGDLIGRSLVKTALALAIDIGIDPSECWAAINYLTDNGEPCYGFYTDEDLVVNRLVGQPFHCVYVKAIKSTKQVLAYVEYFGFQRQVLCLSDGYSGYDIEGMYAVDPTTGQELDLKIELNFSNSDICKIYNGDKQTFNGIQDALGPILDSAVKFSRVRELNRSFDNATKDMQSVVDSSRSAKENNDAMTNELMKHLTPFLNANMNFSDN